MNSENWMYLASTITAESRTAMAEVRFLILVEEEQATDRPPASQLSVAETVLEENTMF